MHKNSGDISLRPIICTFAFFILLLAGFFATPGIFRVVNPEYQLALRTYAAPLARVEKDLADTNRDIIAIDAGLVSQEIAQKKIADDTNAKAARMTADKASADDISKMAIEAATLANAAARDIAQSRFKKQSLEDQKKRLEAEQADILKKLDVSQSDSINLYLVTRALALGAVGALMSIFAKFLLIARPRTSILDDTTVARVAASMAMGAIIGVVVIGLFFTGFISIFPQTQQPTGSPDFWKVTILCLLAGAFSDRLFQAAEKRVDQYVARDEGGAQGETTPPAGSSDRQPGG